MSLKLKPYSEYKESGVPWFGDIPQQWGVLRSKLVFREADFRSITGQELHLSMSQKHGLIPSSQIEERRLISESHVGGKLCEPGDVVLNRLKAHLGVFSVAKQAGIVSPDYTVFRPRILVSPKYYELVLRTPLCRSELRMRAKGIVEGFWRLYTDDFYEIKLPSPPYEEQARIIAFCSTINGRINRLIRSKRRLIELLNEQKEAIIHQAVTRGLDPSVRLKPSGIRWLGNVPEGWTLSRLKNEFECLDNRRVPLSSTERGKMTTRQYDYYGASGVIDRVDDYLFDEDLLLVAEDGANLVLRNLPLAIIARGKYWVNNHAHVLRAKNGNLDYLAHMIENIDFRPWISGAAQPKLTQDRLMAIEVCMPSAAEQNMIITELAKMTAAQSSIIHRTKREIDLLCEYRTRLIADVVTGKLDVRGVELRTLDEEETTEDLESLDAPDPGEIDDIEEIADDDD